MQICPELESCMKFALCGVHTDALALMTLTYVI